MAADPPRKQRVLNEFVLSRDVPVRRDGTVWLDGDAIAWTNHSVHVQLDDPRLGLSRLKSEDVHRRR